MEAKATDFEARRYRGVSNAKPIDEAKRLVSVIDLADRLCGPGRLRRVGKEWAGRCPLPDHEDRSPSFTVNPEKNVWWCFGCLNGGDAVELYRLAHGYSQREAGTAAGFLLLEFGHEPKPKPDSWYQKQERQKPVRNAIEQAKIRAAQRRLYRWIFGPPAERIEDLDERAEEMRRAWDDAGRVAQLVAGLGDAR